MPLLHITVTFLDIQCHASKGPVPGAGGEPEWPPSPLRLFSAMVAGCHWGRGTQPLGPDDDRAFRWLEIQQPPTIIAPEGKAGTQRIFYVPHSGYDVRQRPVPGLEPLRVSKPATPCIIPEMAQVHYLWTVRPGDEEHALRIAERARGVTSLGWGIDHVVACGHLSCQDCLPTTDHDAVVWEPIQSAHPDALRLRVPTRGTLDSFPDPGRARAESHRVENRLCRYWPRHSPLRYYAAFTISRKACSHTDVARVAAMTRHVAITVAEEDPRSLPGGAAIIRSYVAGHVLKGERPARRFSYLPLPSIGHPHADGAVRRVIVAEHPGADGRLAEWASWKLHGRHLVDEQKNPRGTLIRLDSHDGDPGHDRVLSFYTGKFRCWRSVTPVLLPGFDDSNIKNAIELVFRALDHDAMDRDLVESVHVQKAPFWQQSHHPAAYFVPDHLRGYPRWHVEVVFKHKIGGPLSIGAGRHVGLGLMAGADQYS
jgi:CRISPR-associated protein Csb2